MEVERFFCQDCDLEFDGLTAEQAKCCCPECGGQLLEKADGSGLLEEKKQRKFGVLPVAIALSCLAVVFLFVWKSGDGTVDNSSKSQAVAEILKKALEVNDKTPLMVDRSTRLDRIVAEGQTIISKSTLVSITAENVDQNMLKGAIGPFLAEQYCKDKSTRKALELGVFYGHEYYGNDGALLYTATIGLEDC